MTSRKKSILSSVFFLTLLFYVPFLFPKTPYFLHVFIVIWFNVILASSLRIIANAGQLSLCTGGMMSIGAYTSALLVMKTGISSWVALAISGVLVLSFAVIVGYAFARIKGIYFAMVTLFLAEVIRLVAEQWRAVTGGVAGLIGIPRLSPIIINGLTTINFGSRVAFYYLTLILAIIIFLILYAIESSRINISFFSVKQNEDLAESIGVNSIKFKVLAFSIGSFFAGIVGGFYSFYVSCINPETFGFLQSLYVVVYMIVGGANRLIGPLIGAFILTLVPEIFRGLRQYMPLVFAGVLLLAVFFLPDGLVSLPRVLGKVIGKRLNRAGN